jgi:hypothetical protein
MIGRRASQRLWRVPQCQEARPATRLSQRFATERTISPQPARGGAQAAAAADCVVAVGAIRFVVPAASLNVLRTLAFTEAVAFASSIAGEPPSNRRRSSRAQPAKPPPRPRGLVQCFPTAWVSATCSQPARYCDLDVVRRAPLARSECPRKRVTVRSPAPLVRSHGTFASHRVP